MPGGDLHGSLRRWWSYQASKAAESGASRGDDEPVRIGDIGKMKRTRDTANDSLSLIAPVRESERQQGFQAMGVAVSKLAAPIVTKRGGGVLVRLKAEWAAIVGADWAAVAWPSALGRDGVLKLRAASTAALELQHRAPLLIERINLFFGRSVVTRLALVQGPLPLESPPSHTIVPRLAAGEFAALGELLSGIADRDLRAALGRLGRAVMSGRS